MKRQLKRPKIFLGLLVTLAMVLSLFSMAIPVVADFDPADSNANSIDLDLIRPGGEYHIGDTIEFRVIVGVPDADPVIDFYPGKCTSINATFTRPDGVVINFATIPELNRGERVVFNSTTYPGMAYVIDLADANPLATGVVRASANVTGVSHCSDSGPLPDGSEYAYNERNISTDITIEPELCIEKLVDCNDDQEYLHEDTGGYGDTPSWFIRVWNCGDSPLHGINVTDTYGTGWGPFDLDIGESWNVTYDHPGPIYEDTTNNATAVGLSVFDDVVGPVYSAATNVVEIEPLLCIEKLVDCNDDQEYLHEDTGSYGDTPSWKITVWNCGDSPLHAVNVTDTNGMSWGPFDLDIGESWNVTYDGDPIFETTTNNATAVGLDVFDVVVGPVFDSATNIIEEERCWGDETAWAYGGPKAKPNWDYVNDKNWGWTNGPLPEGSYEWDIYAGAGQNDLSKGTVVGKLYVEYACGCVVVTYELDEGYYLGETHLWVGNGVLPMVKKGKTSVYTNAPGRFPFGVDYGFDPEDSGTWEDEWSWNSCIDEGLTFTGNIYVAAHAVVWMEVECPPEVIY